MVGLQEQVLLPKVRKLHLQMSSITDSLFKDGILHRREKVNKSGTYAALGWRILMSNTWVQQNLDEFERKEERRKEERKESSQSHGLHSTITGLKLTNDMISIDIFKLVLVCTTAYFKVCYLRAGLFSVELSAGQCRNFQVLASSFYNHKWRYGKV